MINHNMSSTIGANVRLILMDKTKAVQLRESYNVLHSLMNGNEACPNRVSYSHSDL
jgi:hypothetical protein